MRSVHLVYFPVFGFLLAGCGRHPVAPSSGVPPPAVSKSTVRVSNRPGNTGGGVLIVEYHKLAKEEARWDRSTLSFKKDLERLYGMGFRPVLLSQYVAGSMDLAPGASPVVFTFDDSHPSQIRFGPDGELAPDCALGIWQAFAKDHPDFPIRASFFVLPNTGPWGHDGMADKKFALLKRLGCEVGSHTIGHVNLRKTDHKSAEAELSAAASYILARGFDPLAIALPYGASPKDPELLPKYHKAVLLVGAGPAPSPNDPRRRLMRIPRIQGIDGDYGIGFWLDRIKAGKCSVFVQP